MSRPLPPPARQTSLLSALRQMFWALPAMRLAGPGRDQLRAFDTKMAKVFFLAVYGKIMLAIRGEACTRRRHVELIGNFAVGQVKVSDVTLGAVWHARKFTLAFGDD